MGLEPDAIQQLDDLIGTRIQVMAGKILYDIGNPFDALFAIRLGSRKTTVLAENGVEQVAGYYILGDIMGMDGIGTARHTSRATALEYGEICVLPFDEIENLARDFAGLQHNLHRFCHKKSFANNVSCSH